VTSGGEDLMVGKILIMGKRGRGKGEGGHDLTDDDEGRVWECFL